MADTTAEPISSLTKLISLKKVVVKQKSSGFLSGNKYDVIGPDDAVFFEATEQGMTLLGKNRPFIITLCDEQKREVVTLRRPRRNPVTIMEVSVQGELVSIVLEKLTIISTVLFINDAYNRPIMRIKGPIFKKHSTDFELQTLEKKCIGSVVQEYRGLMHTLFVKQFTYQLQFPLDLDVRYKAVVIAACILIDFLKKER